MAIWRRDGRWLAAACALVCLVGAVAAHSLPGLAQTEARLGVPLTPYPFNDLLTLLAGGESMRDGLDPILQNPHDPAGIRPNYPHLWFYPLAALGVRQNSAFGLGIVLALVFYGSVLRFAGPLRLREGVVWAFFLCAPPVTLAVVRGNNDLVIFILIALALVIRRRATPAALGGSYLILGLCAMLKLYPVATFCLALRARLRVAFTILAAALAGFAVYLYVIRAQVKAIAAVIPDSMFFTYGREVLFRWYGAAHPGVFLPNVASAALAVVVCLLAALAWKHAPPITGLDEPKLEGLMIGSVLYLGPFVLNVNFNYRLIFLLFTLPALLALLRGNRVFYKVTAAAGLILLGVAWTFSGQVNFYFVLVKELANWAVFALMTFLWLQCLPGPSWVSFLPRLAAATGRRAVSSEN